MRKSLRWTLVMVCALTPLVAFAEAPSKPTPGPEHKRLGFFVGNWKGDVEVKPNPMMPSGKYKSTDVCKWFEGGFAVVCHSEGNGPMGPTKGLGIMGYSADEKVYTYYGTDSSGMTMLTVPRGTIDGKTWTYNEESMMGGKPFKSRYTIHELSPTSYSFQWEMQGEDGKWVTVMEGKQTKS